MTYIVYKTTNQINNRYYIGVHKTKNPDVFDGYFGSGRLLKSAISKHGVKNFIRETLVNCGDDEKLAYSMERNLVITNKIDKKSYNIMEGGLGNTSLGEYVVRNKKGIHAVSFEERSRWSKERLRKTDTAILFERNSSGGKKCAELGKSGFKTCTTEQRISWAITAKETRDKNGSYQPFRDVEKQRERGRKGGKKNYGTKCYTDGITGFKFRPTSVDKNIANDEFEEFIRCNPQFKKGRPSKSPKV